MENCCCTMAVQMMVHRQTNVPVGMMPRVGLRLFSLARSLADTIHLGKALQHCSGVTSPVTFLLPANHRQKLTAVLQVVMPGTQSNAIHSNKLAWLRFDPCSAMLRHELCLAKQPKQVDSQSNKHSSHTSKHSSPDPCASHICGEQLCRQSSCSNAMHSVSSYANPFTCGICHSSKQVLCASRWCICSCHALACIDGLA